MRFVKYIDDNYIAYQIFDDNDNWCHSYVILVNKGNIYSRPGTLIDTVFFFPKVIPFNEDDIQGSFNRIDKLLILL